MARSVRYCPELPGIHNRSYYANNTQCNWAPLRIAVLVPVWILEDGLISGWVWRHFQIHSWLITCGLNACAGQRFQ